MSNHGRSLGLTSQAPLTSPKIFLYGYYGFANVGDDLLLSSVTSALFQFAPNARFVVRSLNPVGSLSDERIQYLTIEQIMSRVIWPRWRRLIYYAWEAWGSLRGCSHLVFGGGTLFHARGGSNVNLFLIGMLVVMARIRGARVFALGVGVASLPRGLSSHLMAGILGLTHDFAVRDESSRANCQRLLFASRVRLTADMVFALPMGEIKRVPGQTPVLGVSLAASDIGQDGLGNEEFLEALAVALQRLWKDGWEIRFLSFQELDEGGVKVSDSSLFARLSRYGFREAAKIMRVSSLPGEISRQLSDLDVIAGMRFHGHVLAVRLGIPFVGFGRDSKLVDLCRHFSMPFVAMSELHADHFAKAVEQTRMLVPDQEKVRILSEVAVSNFSIVGASFS